MKWVGAVVLVGLALLVVPVIAIGFAFIGISPVEDGQRLGPVLAVKDSYTTAFIVETLDGPFLIDAGLDTDAAAILAALDALGWGRDDVRALFITHGHSDHIGGCAAFPHATVYALAAEAPIVSGARASGGPLPRWFPSDGACQVHRTLSDGEVVNMGGTEVLALSVPGHTEGSAVYVVGEVAFMGDAGSATTDGAVRGPPWVFSDDVHQADASLVTLADRLPERVRWLAFSHTGPLDGTEPLSALTPR